MDDSCLEEECNEELPSLLEFLNEIDRDNTYLQWDGEKWSQDASSTASDPILIDKNTKDTRDDMRQLQEVLGLKQSLLGRYRISDDSYLPELMVLREKWRESSNERCLECAKKVNTQGWKAVRFGNQYSISPSRVTINSKIKYTLKNKYFQTIPLGSNPIIFCSRHGNKFLKNNFKDNLDELNTVNTAYFTSLSGSFPIKKATALVMEKFPQEREQGQLSITGFMPQEDIDIPDAKNEEESATAVDNKKRKSPTTVDKKKLKKRKQQIDINELRYELYRRVIDFVKNGTDDRPNVPSAHMRRQGWWRNVRTRQDSSGRTVTYPTVEVPDDHVANLDLIDRFILSQPVLCDRSNNVITSPSTLYAPEVEIFICGNKTFEETIEQLFEIYKPLFLRDPVGNGNALHFWKNNEQLFPRSSGGRRKRKTKRRRKKKKKTRIKNKRRKKTKRRRKKRKKTRRKR